MSFNEEQKLIDVSAQGGSASGGKAPADANALADKPADKSADSVSPDAGPVEPTDPAQAPEILEGESHLTKKESRLISLLVRHADANVGAIAEKMNLSSHEVFEVCSRLKEKGYNILITRGDETFISLPRDEEPNPEAIPINAISHKFRVAFIAEPRMGSKQSQISLLYSLFELFEKEGVDFVVLAGGLVVGKPTRTLRPDIIRVTAPAQANYVVANFPKSKRFKTYVIAGRRELSFKNDRGYDIVSVIASQREDIVAAGDLSRTFSIKGVRIKVASPWDDNSPIGKSYGPQKIADNISDDPFPDIIVMGSTHISSEIPYYVNGAPVFTVPSLHMPMGRQGGVRGVAPDVGCLILELNFTKNWKLQQQGGGIRAHMVVLNKYVRVDDYLTSNADVPVDELTNDEKQVLEWLEKEPHSPGELSRRLKKSKGTVDKILKRLAQFGLEISEPKDTKKVTLRRPEKQRFAPLPIKWEEVFQKRLKAGYVSDTHYGSRQELPAIVRHAYQDAAEAGVDIMFHTGDVTDGPGLAGYRGHANDVLMVRLQDMIEHTAQEWPRQEITVSGEKTILKTKIISGNHDGWGEKALGICPVWVLSLMLRDEINYLGSQVASTVENGIFHKLLHPAGGLGYTLSMKLEREIKAVKKKREGQDMPRVVVLGNWHVAYLLVRDTVGLLVPCFKAVDEFHETRALVPSIGMWILEIFTDKDGNVTRVISDYRDYQHLVNSTKIRK